MSMFIQRPKKIRSRARNALAHLRLQWHLRLRRQPYDDITRFEKKIFSQNGEDGILEAIFAKIGATSRYFVELGVGDGSECNSARLVRQGWQGLQIDRSAVPGSAIISAFITAEKIAGLFQAYNVPESFDLLSIDIDGNDYWIWQALHRYRPRVVVIEYNASLGPTASSVISYDPAFRWDASDYFGASLAALQKLGTKMGYTLVGCDSMGVNAFFVAASLTSGNFSAHPVSKLYRPPRYQRGQGHPHRPDGIWQTV